ncbi:hypothetical protein T4B_14703 [Trichinella pseudospiralis]|uniref:Uncharacterized protein n=1 Tax=Trichinella pseudospiralis TaxID=6337 RepID=A0A0V1J3I4_TRIPS|nr:hypothetical protein T4B_14703 [Trichinella pseudospiralis]
MELVLGGAFYHHRDKHSISRALKGGGPAFKNSCSNANVKLCLTDFSTDNFIRSTYPTSWNLPHTGNLFTQRYSHLSMYKLK